MKKKQQQPKAPYRRGSRLSNGKTTYKVVRCDAAKCHACHGSGILWTVTLKSAYRNFETALDSLLKGGYVVVERKKKGEPDADSSDGNGGDGQEPVSA